MTYETILEAVCGDSETFQRIKDLPNDSIVNISNDDIKNCIDNYLKDPNEKTKLEDMIIQRVSQKINERVSRCNNALNNNIAKYTKNNVNKKKEIDNYDSEQLNNILNKVIDINNNPDTYNNDEALEIFKKITSPAFIRDLLLKYELGYYVSKDLIVCDINKKVEISNMIKCDIDKFHSLSPSHPTDNKTNIKDHYFHHNEWSINYEDTLMYEVPNNTVVFTNTIDKYDYESDDNVIINNLSNYLTNITNYLKKKYKSPKIKKYITRSEKYDIYFAFIIVGFC